MSGAANEAAGGSRLERELAYYRRELNDLGSKLIRLQEEQQRTFLEAQRSRLVAKMVRELYGALGTSGASLPDLVLRIVAENATCACAALFRERPLGSESFALVGAVGLPQEAGQPAPLRLRQAPSFVFTTAAAQPEPPASEIAAYLGAPYLLWAHDAASGYALALGNRIEANASRPFELADQELIETALTVFLDAQSRTARAPASVDSGSHDAGDDAGEACGLESGELRQQLRRGGRVLGVVVVERPSAEGCEYVAYLNVTWKPDWHVLRAWRDRGDRTYRHLNPLFQTVRSDFEFMGPIMAYAPDSPELGRIPTVAARERRQRGQVDHRTSVTMPVNSTKTRVEAGT